MRVLDLFAGIGGFSLAAHWMGWETAAFVEWEKYCQKVLQKNFPGVPIFSDIRDFDGTKYRGQIDIITGGFPCQPFSQAGKQKGKDDQRYLFPEMLRVIEEVRPGYVVAENVRGLLSIENGEVFTEICSQLESKGYNVWTFGIPASAVEAPHERMRVWIVCNNSDAYQTGTSGLSSGKEEEEEYTGFGIHNRDASDSDNERHIRRSESGKSGERPVHSGRGEHRSLSESSVNSSQSSNTRNTRNTRLQGNELTGTLSEDTRTSRPITERFSNELWIEAATRFCRMDDGIPAELDFPRDNRVNRLKALGNSIVPQIAYEIFRSIEAAQ